MPRMHTLHPNQRTVGFVHLWLQGLECSCAVSSPTVGHLQPHPDGPDSGCYAGGSAHFQLTNIDQPSKACVCCDHFLTMCCLWLRG
jgi:hypothetical protein